MDATCVVQRPQFHKADRDVEINHTNLITQYPKKKKKQTAVLQRSQFALHPTVTKGEMEEHRSFIIFDFFRAPVGFIRPSVPPRPNMIIDLLSCVQIRSDIDLLFKVGCALEHM